MRLAPLIFVALAITGSPVSGEPGPGDADQGYALARLNFRGRHVIFAIMLFTMTLPFQITLIPQYILMVKFHWTETYLALIVPYFVNAFAIILFRQHFLTIPQDLVDAARIDGCSEAYILFRIFWPLSVPTLITVGIITFMTSWNEVLWPLIVIHERDMMTMPLRPDSAWEVELGVKDFDPCPNLVDSVVCRSYSLPRDIEASGNGQLYLVWHSLAVEPVTEDTE